MRRRSGRKDKLQEIARCKAGRVVASVALDEPKRNPRWVMHMHGRHIASLWDHLRAARQLCWNPKTYWLGLTETVAEKKFQKRGYGPRLTPMHLPRVNSDDDMAIGWTWSMKSWWQILNNYLLNKDKVISEQAVTIQDTVNYQGSLHQEKPSCNFSPRSSVVGSVSASLPICLLLRLNAIPPQS